MTQSAAHSAFGASLPRNGGSVRFPVDPVSLGVIRPSNVVANAFSPGLHLVAHRALTSRSVQCQGGETETFQRGLIGRKASMGADGAPTPHCDLVTGGKAGSSQYLKYATPAQFAAHNVGAVANAH